MTKSSKSSQSSQWWWPCPWSDHGFPQRMLHPPRSHTIHLLTIIIIIIIIVISILIVITILITTIPLLILTMNEEEGGTRRESSMLGKRRRAGHALPVTTVHTASLPSWTAHSELCKHCIFHSVNIPILQTLIWCLCTAEHTTLHSICTAYNSQAVDPNFTLHTL